MRMEPCCGENPAGELLGESHRLRGAVGIDTGSHQPFDFIGAIEKLARWSPVELQMAMRVYPWHPW